MNWETLKFFPKYLILMALTPALILGDQWTKYVILKRFTMGETIPVVSGYFNLTYVRNTEQPSAFWRPRIPHFESRFSSLSRFWP